MSSFAGSILVILFGVAWRDFAVGSPLIILGVLAASFAAVGLLRASAGVIGISLIVLGSSVIGSGVGNGSGAGGAGFYAIASIFSILFIMAGIMICLLGIPKRESEPRQA